MIAEAQQWIEINRFLLEWMFIFSVGTFVVGVFLAVMGIVYLPRDYFSPGYKPFSRKISNVFIRRIYLVGKNVIGMMIITAGLAMLVLPGQGVLTIAIGLSLTDFPGKHKIAGRLIRRGAVLRGANWLRKKAGKLPLDPFEDH